VLLAWARDRDGAKVHAGALDATRRGARAPFTCLGCGEPLVARLGRVRARHFAHAPGSTCPLTAPETALHLDAKERLLRLCEDAFAGRSRVILEARCPRCRGRAPRDLAALGDAARPEAAVGPLRADVLVTAAGRAALAIEVRVTHAVDGTKEDALAAWGVPAIEVDAREDWLEQGNAAASIRCARSLGFSPCARCEAAARAEAEREKGGEAAEIAELEGYRARGLLGPPPLARESGLEGGTPLSRVERSALRAAFRCPDCAGREVQIGERLARHRCRGGPDRPIAWRGYDGTLVEMAWWRR
jgi:hypothetical protein